ncbi:MAG: LytTR family DNA-binding domain-containing protein [Draconibacterium sp.]
MLQLLNKKFTLLDQKQDRLFLIVVVFVFSVFFLNIFEPFNIGRWYSDSGIIKFLRLSSYGFVIALVYLFTQFPLRRFFKTTAFTVKSYLLWLFIEIVLISLVYIFLYGNPLGNFVNDFLFSTKYTLLGIVLPYTFAVLLIYYKKQKAEIKTLQNEASKPSEKRLIVFKDESGKVKFSVQSQDILLLESTDNYISVYYSFENKVQRKLLRNTLKNMEEMLEKSNIVRCHRSFMVNINNIDFVQKEGKKMIVRIKQLNNEIPVSQKYSSLFIDLLS